MNWLLITILAYFLLAITAEVDKFLLDKVLSSSRAYAFLICSLSALVLLIAPWYLSWPGWSGLVLALASGFSFCAALVFMFEALRWGEASRMTVVTGGFVAIFSLILSILFLHASFSLTQVIGMLFMLGGIFLIALISSGQTKKIVTNKKAFYFSLLSGLLFALSFIGTKYVYSSQNALSGFIWIRIGSVILSLLFLLRAKDRADILASFKPGPKTEKFSRQFLILGNQGLGAIAFVLQNYAIFLGPVAIINALQGVQYAFLLIFGLILTAFYPNIIKENVSRPIVIKKILAIVLISIGLYFVSI